MDNEGEKSNQRLRQEALEFLYSTLREMAAALDRRTNPSNETVTAWCAGMRDLAQTIDILEDLEAAAHE